MYLKNYPLLLLTVFTAIAFCSCEKQDAGGLKAQLALSLNSDSSTFNVKNSAGKLAPAPANVTFTGGVMNINTFQFNGTKDGQPVQYVTATAPNIDIFSAAPAAFITTLDNGTYTNVVLSVALVKSTFIIPLLLKGTYKSAAGVTVQLEVDYNDNSTIKTKVKDQLVVDGQSDFSSDVKVHLDKLFAGVTSNDLDNATRVNGVLLITSIYNKAIYAKIKANIVNSGGTDGVEIFLED